MTAMLKLPSMSELKALRHPVRNVNKSHAEQLGTLERVAVWITDHVGSMGFFIVIFAWTMLWLGWNALGPKAERFDPFPAFVLWLAPWHGCPSCQMRPPHSEPKLSFSVRIIST